jgi:hypothetical protein
MYIIDFLFRIVRVNQELSEARLGLYEHILCCVVHSPSEQAEHSDFAHNALIEALN